MNIEKLPRPLNDKVLIKVVDAGDEVTSCGIIIPSTANEPPRIGEVLAVGQGGDIHPMSVNVGDIVFYGRYAATNGVEFESNGEKYIIISENDVYAAI